MRKALHITLTNLLFESRVFKECQSLHSALDLDLTVFGMHDPGLPLKETKDFLEIVRFPLPTRSWPKRVPFQLIKFLECREKMIQAARKLRPDLVHVHSLEALPVGAGIARAMRIPLIYDAHELETEVEGVRHNVLFKRLRKYAENRYIRKADAVITVNESIAGVYTELYGINRPYVILNCPHVREPIKKDYFREYFSIPKNHYIFLYQGLLTTGRGLNQLLEAFTMLQNSPVHLVIMGYGPMEPLILNYTGKHQRIHYKEAVPPEELLAWTASADVGLCTIEDTSLSYYYCLPNKIFEYLMGGLPVLCSSLPELRSLVLNHRVGWVLEENTAEEIKKSVEAIINENLNLLKDNSRKAASIYNWETQEKKLIDIYANLLV